MVVDLEMGPVIALQRIIMSLNYVIQTDVYFGWKMQEMTSNHMEMTVEK